MAAIARQVKRLQPILASFRTQATHSRLLSTPAAREHVEVLYDGKCPLCIAEIKFLKKIDRKEKIAFVDIATKDFKPENHSNISYEQAMAEMHVIDTDGTIHKRMPSFHVMYGALGLGWVWGWTKLPGMEPIAEKIYMYWANNRLKWTGRANECPDGRCEVKFQGKKEGEKSDKS